MIFVAPASLTRATSFFLAGLLVVSLPCAESPAGLVSSFADIEFWVGSGANQAAFVVDWQDGREPLAWGYRWDGTASGEQMLRAVVTADPRLYAKIGTAGSFGVPVYGFGYDRDEDGFGISDGTPFPSSGLFVSNIVPDQFGSAATSNDPHDSYREGWYTGFWSYWQQSGSTLGTWTSGQSGPSGRTLTDGAWDGWSFDATFSFNIAPSQPQAATATPEPAMIWLVLLAGAMLWIQRRVVRRAKP